MAPPALRAGIEGRAKRRSASLGLGAILLSELNESRRVTIVLVTHHTFGATYGHRTIELADGRIVHDVETPARARLHLVSEESS
jgi:hypothetical protein